MEVHIEHKADAPEEARAASVTHGMHAFGHVVEHIEERGAEH